MADVNTLLRIEHLKVCFPLRSVIGRIRSYVKAVNDVSLSLFQGETYGLVGETGCGKSTLGRTIIGLEKAAGGEIYFDNRDLLKLSSKEMLKLRPKIQMVFQDPYSSLNPRKRIGDILTEVLEIHNIGAREERPEIALDILERVGLLPEHYYRFPSEFSGGQRQRVGLARAFLLKPKLIICDEPVSALDVSIRAQIINLLKDLQESEKSAYLFIAHDLSIVRYISSRIGVMYLGCLVEEAPAEQLFRNPLHPYTRALLSASPSIDVDSLRERERLEGELPSPIDPPPGCPFHTRCSRAIGTCGQYRPQFREMEKGQKVACVLYE
jgi:peptide/nickel transport system ATP-binding protein/oligopeptide transport system ATP-binding protein